jgi:hypothetical protein
MSTSIPLLIKELVGIPNEWEILQSGTSEAHESFTFLLRPRSMGKLWLGLGKRAVYHGRMDGNVDVYSGLALLTHKRIEEEVKTHADIDMCCI